MLNGPELCIEDIIQKIKTYQPDAVSEQVQEAYEFAKEAHAGQTRVSGEEYIIHPLGVANILADLQIDAVTIIAALLHDVGRRKGDLDLFGKVAAVLLTHFFPRRSRAWAAAGCRLLFVYYEHPAIGAATTPPATSPATAQAC